MKLKIYFGHLDDFWLEKFVYKNLFTFGHVTKFVYKSHDKNYTRIILGDLCLEKAYKTIFDEIREQHFCGNDKTKYLEGHPMLLDLKKQLNIVHCAALQ